MSKYKTEKVLYPCREQQTEALLFDVDTLLHNGERKDAADMLLSILCEAVSNNDQLLIEECLRKHKGMRNQFCSFKPNYSAVNATDNNNRPSDPIAPVIPNDLLRCKKEYEEWDDSFDFIFDNRIIVKKLKNTLDKLTFNKDSHVTWFVVYKVFLHLKWLTEGCKPRLFLQWVNLHYNCGWKRDYNFIFSRNVDAALRNNDISLWKNMSANPNITYNQGSKYYNFAVLLRNTFEIVTINGKEQKEPVQDFIVGKNRDRYEFVLNPNNLINTGE